MLVSDEPVVFPDDDGDAGPPYHEVERNRFFLAKHSMTKATLLLSIVAVAAMIVNPEMIDEVWQFVSYFVVFIFGRISDHYFRSQ